MPKRRHSRTESREIPDLALSLVLPRLTNTDDRTALSMVSRQFNRQLRTNSALWTHVKRLCFTGEWDKRAMVQLPNEDTVTVGVMKPRKLADVSKHMDKLENNVLPLLSLCRQVREVHINGGWLSDSLRLQTESNVDFGSAVEARILEAIAPQDPDQAPMIELPALRSLFVTIDPMHYKDTQGFKRLFEALLTRPNVYLFFNYKNDQEPALKGFDINDVSKSTLKQAASQLPIDKLIAPYWHKLQGFRYTRKTKFVQLFLQRIHNEPPDQLTHIKLPIEGAAFTLTRLKESETEHLEHVTFDVLNPNERLHIDVIPKLIEKPFTNLKTIDVQISDTNIARQWFPNGASMQQMIECLAEACPRLSTVDIQVCLIHHEPMLRFTMSAAQVGSIIQAFAGDLTTRGPAIRVNLGEIRISCEEVCASFYSPHNEEPQLNKILRNSYGANFNGEIKTKAVDAHGTCKWNTVELCIGRQNIAIEFYGDQFLYYERIKQEVLAEYENVFDAVINGPLPDSLDEYLRPRNL